MPTISGKVRISGGSAGLTSCIIEVSRLAVKSNSGKSGPPTSEQNIVLTMAYTENDGTFEVSVADEWFPVVCRVCSGAAPNQTLVRRKLKSARSGIDFAISHEQISQIFQLHSGQSGDIEPALLNSGRPDSATVWARTQAAETLRKNKDRFEDIRGRFKGFDPAADDDFDEAFIANGASSRVILEKTVNLAQSSLIDTPKVEKEFFQFGQKVPTSRCNFREILPMFTDRSLSLTSDETELIESIRRDRAGTSDLAATQMSGAPPAAAEGAESGVENPGPTEDPEPKLHTGGDLDSYIAARLSVIDYPGRSLYQSQPLSPGEIQNNLHNQTIPSPLQSPAIHDHRVVQMAFPWVWSRVVDPSIRRQAQEVFRYLLKAGDVFDSLPKADVTLESLSPILDAAREFTLEIEQLNLEPVPGILLDLNLGVSIEIWNEMSSVESAELLVTAQSIVNLAEPIHPTSVPVFDGRTLDNDRDGQPFEGSWFIIDQALNRDALKFFAYSGASLGSLTGVEWVRVDTGWPSAEILLERDRPVGGGEYNTYANLPGTGKEAFTLGNLTYVRASLVRELRDSTWRGQAENLVTTVEQRLSQRSALQQEHSLTTVLESLSNAMSSQTHQFKVYPEGAMNFGLMLTYRQQWTSKGFQAHELVKTLPLAPGESRKYTTKVVKKSSSKRVETTVSATERNAEERQNNRNINEVLDRLTDSKKLSATAQGSASIGVVSFGGSATIGADSSGLSSKNKKKIRESVLNAANQFKNERRLVVETGNSDEKTLDSTEEITNPNDELTVTYLFYELGQRFQVSEKLVAVDPVILVAEAVPNPDKIDKGWLLRHDWIIVREILDESFLPALAMVRKSEQGQDVAIGILAKDLALKTETYQELRSQFGVISELRNTATDRLAAAVRQRVEAINEQVGDADHAKDLALTIFTHGLFGSQGLLGEGGVEEPLADDPAAAEIRNEAAEATLERMDREVRQLQSRLDSASSQMGAAIEKYTEAIRVRLDNELAILRLRHHVMQNILHYMKAIWSQENSDQRYFKLHKIKVPEIGGTAKVTVKGEVYTIELDSPKFDIDNTARLADLADLGTVHGYFGNSAIYRLHDHNYITARMAQDFLGRHGEVVDPDKEIPRGGDLDSIIYSADRKLAAETDEGKKAKLKNLVKSLKSKIMVGNDRVDEIVLPTDLLFVEALVGKNPLLENFKREHRQLDAERVAEIVRAQKLENLRLAAQLLKGKTETEIDKYIKVDGAAELHTETN